METNVTSSYTDIYVNGGGNWITESYPTNFHHFYKRKMLSGLESISDYREVTEAEKSVIEAADAAWVRPTRSFILRWNTACGPYGRYNEATGYFELNGIVDITYEEAVRILEVSAHGTANIQGDKITGLYSMNLNVRTVLPIKSNATLSLSQTFALNSSIEAVRFVETRAGFFKVNSFDFTFSNCSKLKHIYGVLTTSSVRFLESFDQCWELETVYIKGLNTYLALFRSPKLSLDSFQYMIANAVTTASGFAIQVHPNVYAKLTGDTSKTAAAALSEEELAQWMALVPLAAEKNITFTL